MGLNERQRQILEWTEKKQRISVSLLAKKLYVSEMTVRRDLDKMEQEGFLRRYHGGAVANSEHMQDPIDLRMHVNEKEKRDNWELAFCELYAGGKYRSEEHTV